MVLFHCKSDNHTLPIYFGTKTQLLIVFKDAVYALLSIAQIHVNARYRTVFREQLRRLGSPHRTVGKAQRYLGQYEGGISRHEAPAYLV